MVFRDVKVAVPMFFIAFVEALYQKDVWKKERVVIYRCASSKYMPA